MSRKNLYSPGNLEPYKLSRTKIELFLRCPRCFYLDRRFGIGQPGGLPFTLNSAVDALLKAEFDGYRLRCEPHPIMLEHRIDAIPFSHPNLNVWRHNFTGVQHLHRETNLLVYGAVDDLWVASNGQLLVIDYKATSTEKPITLEDQWKTSYKRQMEFYQYLLRRLGFDVNRTGYFVYANGLKNEAAFESVLRFKLHLLPYDGNDTWVEAAISEAKACLERNVPPASAEDCEFCLYRSLAREVES